MDKEIREELESLGQADRWYTPTPVPGGDAQTIDALFDDLAMATPSASRASATARIKDGPASAAGASIRRSGRRGERTNDG